MVMPDYLGSAQKVKKKQCVLRVSFDLKVTCLVIPEYTCKTNQDCTMNGMECKNDKCVCVADFLADGDVCKAKGKTVACSN